MLHVVVALPAEARPMIAAWRLDRDLDPRNLGHDAFPVYRSDDKALVVSGMGASQAAAATAHLFHVAGSIRDAAWLNVGVAGHPTRVIGEAVVATKVQDAMTGAVFYPPRLGPRRAPGVTVETVPKVDTRYEGDVAVEMEASGFLTAALRYTTNELAQVIKVVSDNREEPAGPHLDATTLAGRIGARLDVVEAVASDLAPHASALAERRRLPADYERLVAEGRWSVTDRRRLRRLLERRAVLAAEVSLPVEIDREWRGSDVNRLLAAWLETLPVTLEAAGSVTADEDTDG